MAENFIFSYQNKQQKCEDCVFDYKELEEKFISTFGLDKDMESQLKFYIDGKEINENDDIMDLIKPDNIIEVKNIKEEVKIEKPEKDEKEKKIGEPETDEKEKKIGEPETNEKVKKIEEPETKKGNNVNETNKNHDSKDVDIYISEKLEENNQRLEKIILEKNEEKIQNLKDELLKEIENKIDTKFTENEINKKMEDIDNKINKLNQDYLEFKSIKIKFFNKFIEVLDNKSIPQDLAKSEQPEAPQKTEDIDSLKEQNIKLKTMIKKLKKEKDEMKDKYEKEFSNKGNLDDITPQLENLKKENEKLKEERENLNTKIKNLENEIKKKNELKTSTSLSSSKIMQKKYNCKLICKKDNIYPYNEVSEKEAIQLNLTIKNAGEDDLPKNCEIQLMNEINGLNLEKFKTNNIIKESEEIAIKFKIDINTIEVNKDIDVRLKLVDNNNKDIPGGKCKLNINIKKEEKAIEDEAETQNNNIVLEDSDYEYLFKEINDILQIENCGENMSSFKEKLAGLLENKKEKYESISEKKEYIDTLKEDLEEIFT